MNNDKISLLKKKISSLKAHYTLCRLCPRDCKVNRAKNERGYCNAGPQVTVYTAFRHFGEEPAISQDTGSGAIFFSGCSLQCVYCQNYKFSSNNTGKQMSSEELARLILSLQRKKAVNINLVSPSHYLPQIAEALILAGEKGLNIPIVYNTSGYEKKDIIKSLDGIVDIYLTDLKYLDCQKAKIYSNAENYPLIATEAIKEMIRQVKTTWDRDKLVKGVIIRHLALPASSEDSLKVMLWIKNNAPRSLLSLMFQFQPYFKAAQYPEINRKLNLQEYKYLKNTAEKLNLPGWIQEYETAEELAGTHFVQAIDDSLSEKEDGYSS